METRKTKLNFCMMLFILFTSTTGFIEAQVTIGSSYKSNLGSILDLKQKDSSNRVTADKGMNLPRVSLKNLTPINSTEFAASIGNIGDWSLESHVGLLVYNAVNYASGSTKIVEGLYVWNGLKWQQILYSDN